MKKFMFLLAILSIVGWLVSGCGESKKYITKLDDIKTESIGAMTGTTGEQLAKKRFPEATIKSFDDIMDAVAALKSNQLDAVITSFPTALNVSKRNPDLYYLPEPVDYENTAIAVRKGNRNLLAKLNEFINELKNDGTLKDMKRRWFKKELTPYETVEIKPTLKGNLLKIGVSATREPFCYVNEKRDVTGHDGELARRIGLKFNRPIQFVDMKFSALISALQSGKIDMIVTGMTATEERKKKVDFSESYFENSQVILTKKEIDAKNETENSPTKLKTINDLKNKRIGVLLGSVHDTYAMKNFPTATVLQYKSPSEILLAVRSRKVDAAIYTTETLIEILRTNNELTLFGDTLFTVPIGMGFNKENDALKEKFNSFLQKIKSDGVFADMVDRWITKGETIMPEVKNPKTNGTLVVGTVSDKGLPFTIVKDGRMIGFDTELCERFAASLGRELKLVDMEFGSLIAAAATNKIEMIASTLMLTEERKKQIDFSTPYLRLRANFFTLKKNIEISGEDKLRTLEDAADKVSGVYAGSIHDAFVERTFPKAEIKRFNAWADMILSLKAKKIDVAYVDLCSAKVLLKSNQEIGILTEEALTLPVGYGFSKKNPNLRNKFNAFLKASKTNGVYDTIYKRWFINDPEKAVMPKIDFNPNGKKVKLGVAVGDLPNSAIVNGEHVGFDIEFLKTFAKAENFNMKIITMEFSSLVAALAAGKVDIIADGIAITEERQKQVDFSEPYNQLKTAVLALKTNLAAFANLSKESDNQPTSFFSFMNGIAESFHNNIILENRYLLIIDGLKTTAIISILSIIFGTALGGLICFMRMSKKKILLLPAKFYISVLRGTPVLVVLMIIFYVVFASVDIDPTIVAVIAFGLNFAAYVSEMFRTGIESIDPGQTEAGIAMGFTKVQTFIHIVAPQAARRILPVYKGEVISLVKMTSIVGYIAVQDLTKASDIIRSRTFDAFFPLIMVAVLYFIISWLLISFLGYIERTTDPKLKVKRG
jgi:polar amino acid transport system substrate-binding protein